MLIHMRANASRTKSGFSVEGTVSWDNEVHSPVLKDVDDATDLLREKVTEHLSALMAGLEAKFPREGDQQG